MVSQRKRIVVVDDEPDLAQLFSDGLAMAGFKAYPFDNPEVAIEYIGSNASHISLVITDWKMPRFNGFQLTKMLNQIDREIKVMLISAFELDIQGLKQINKDEYLQKPIHIANLIEAVKRELNLTTNSKVDETKLTP
jgi:two-component system response regulator (stage 0 sporulation protein F)